MLNWQRVKLHYGKDLSWGERIWGRPNTIFGPGVEINFVNNKTIHFDLDLQHKIHGPNPETDVDFDLVFSCNNGVIKTNIKNLRIEDKGWVYEVQKWVREKGSTLIGTAIGTELGQPVAGAAAGGALSKFLSFSINIDLQNPNVSSSCESINILPTGDIKLR